MLYAVIIAGGAGKRLWPKSRVNLPKFFLKLKGKKSLLQETVARAKLFIPRNNILIITNREDLKIIYKQLPGFPRKNVIAEPVSRNTAAAVCVAASLVKKKDANGVIFIMPADHIIGDKLTIKEIFSLASLMAGLKKSLITLGIKPTFPATGFGYIKTGSLYKRLLADKKYAIYKVDRFVEKPALKKARNFLKSKRYLWNSGIFIGEAQTFLDEFKRYQPRIYKIVKRIEKGLGTQKQQSLINRHYKEFPDISIDYAIMEKTKRAYVIKADISWQDIGSWMSLKHYLKKDARGNIIMGRYFGIDVKDSIVSGEKEHLIAAVGVNNIIIIQTKDATLVCSKDRAGDVKKLVEALEEKKGLKRYL